MSKLLWWSLPILTLVIGTAWAIWKAKPRRAGRPDKEIEKRRKFEQAVTKFTDADSSVQADQE